MGKILRTEERAMSVDGEQRGHVLGRSLLRQVLFVEVLNGRSRTGSFFCLAAMNGVFSDRIRIDVDSDGKLRRESSRCEELIVDLLRIDRLRTDSFALRSISDRSDIRRSSDRYW